MADAVRILFFPSLGAGVVCCLLWRRLPDRDRHLGLLLVGAGLFVIPQFIVVAVGTVATELLLHRQVVLGIWLSLLGAFAAWKAVRILEGRPLPDNYRSQRQLHNSPIILGIIALSFGGFGLNMLWLSAEDLLLPHAVYQGQITRKWIQHGTRSAPQYYFVVNGRSVEVGRDLYTRVRPGEVVRVEIAAGSHTVIGAYRVISPSY
ncbi:MAG TPA: hypothetical protein VFP86_12955 [bacterium]|nr:hypothetical protein [bacterium]